MTLNYCFLNFNSSPYFYLVLCFANSFVPCLSSLLFLNYVSCICILHTILFLALHYLLSYFTSFASPSLSFYVCFYIFTFYSFLLQILYCISTSHLMFFAFETVYCIPYCIPTCLVSCHNSKNTFSPETLLHYNVFSCACSRFILFVFLNNANC